jgi:hypothetical protein
MGTLLEILSKLLTPSIGSYVVIGLGIGIIAGLLRNAVRRYGIVKAMLAVAGIVIALLGMRCIPSPASAEAQPPPAAPRPRPSPGQAYGGGLTKASPSPARHKVHRRRRYVQYPGF